MGEYSELRARLGSEVRRRHEAESEAMGERHARERRELEVEVEA